MSMPAQVAAPPAGGAWAAPLRRLKREKLGLAGLGFIGLLVVVALLAPWIAPYDPTVQNLNNVLQPPGWAHLAGTDELGRDIFSRLVWGSRITLQIVGTVTLIIGPIGLLIGVVAGYCGGRVDAVLMRATDIVLSFPSLVLALAFAAALGAGLGTAIVAISLTAWPSIARLARAETLVVRQAEYIAAARLYGASHLRLIGLYVMPMCIPSVIVRITLNMAGIILTAAGLGFLGLGAQPPMPEWGAMLSVGRQNLSAWWLSAAPGLAILLTSLAFNLFGDGLRDVLDPRSE